MRIATWNVNSVTVRLPRLLEWLELAQPDVLCLQETKIANAQFPNDDIRALGYEIATHGTAGGRNGVAIISRVGLDAVVYSFTNEPGFPELEARALAATCGGVRLWSVYIPNGRTVGSEAFTYKLDWLAALLEALRNEIQQPLAVCGDFNVAPTNEDVWDPMAFVGSTHVSDEERAAVAKLVDLGFVDVQPRAFKGKPFTYWDYRGGNFHKGMGMRIDLMLLTQELAARVKDAYIDRDARKGTLPSDHAPVVVDLDENPST